MKNLLYKEIRLVIQPPAYLFVLCAALLLIPAYPYFVGVSYFIFAIQINFSLMRANKDQEFTSMLPISRAQIVSGKTVSICFLEMLQLGLSVVFGLLSSFVVNKGGNPVGMDANAAFFGMTLIAYSVFNMIFIPKFFKTGYKMGFPLIFAIVGYLITVGIFELVVNLVPSLKISIDGLDPQYLWSRLIVLGFGIICYLFTLVLATKIAVKNFSKVSL